MEFDAKLFEEYGYKAHHKGFFAEWQAMTSSLSKEKELPLDEAAKRAYEQLKITQGSA